MESSILKQIARFLQEQKKQKRWLVVFLCLAIIVGFGTVTALKMRGQAMTHKEKRVICQLAVHQHADECYDENKENLICGYADYVLSLVEEAKREYGIEFTDLKDVRDVNAVILAVAHDVFLNLTESDIAAMYQEGEKKVLLDIKGLLNRKNYEEAGYRYWRL